MDELTIEITLKNIINEFLWTAPVEVANSDKALLYFKNEVRNTIIKTLAIAKDD